MGIVKGDAGSFDSSSCRVYMGTYTDEFSRCICILPPTSVFSKVFSVDARIAATVPSVLSLCRSLPYVPPRTDTI